MAARQTDIRLNARFHEMLDDVRPALSEEKWEEWLKTIAQRGSGCRLSLNLSTAKRWLSGGTARLHEFKKFFGEFRVAFPDVLNRLRIRSVQDLIELPPSRCHSVPHDGNDERILRLLELRHAEKTEHVRSIFTGLDRRYDVTSNARSLLQEPIVANRVLKLAEPLVLDTCEETGFTAILMATVDAYDPTPRRRACLQEVCERNLGKQPGRGWVGSLAYAVGKRGAMDVYVRHLRTIAGDSELRAADARSKVRYYGGSPGPTLCAMYRHLAEESVRPGLTQVGDFPALVHLASVSSPDFQRPAIQDAMSKLFVEILRRMKKLGFEGDDLFKQAQRFKEHLCRPTR